MSLVESDLISCVEVTLSQPVEKENIIDLLDLTVGEVIKFVLMLSISHFLV